MSLEKRIRPRAMVRAHDDAGRGLCGPGPVWFRGRLEWRTEGVEVAAPGTQSDMRMSVMDVGSNTVRLVVADAEDGVPLPVHTAKWKLRLSEQVGPGGVIPEESVRAARRRRSPLPPGPPERWGAAEPLAFATAVVRDAPNRLDVLRTVGERTGVRLCTLPGEVEAELTFLGARRWMGWRAGPLALFDIGGGSLEVAFGRGRLPGLRGLAAARRAPADPGVLRRQDPPSEQSAEGAAPPGAPPAAGRGRTDPLGGAPHGRGHLAHVPAAGPALRRRPRPPGPLHGTAVEPGGPRALP